MQSAKETASNVAASAKSGMEKTKAVAQEKAEKMTTRDPLKKEMAEQKKDARINEAERMKHDTRAENAAARREHGHGYGQDYTATGYNTGTTDLPAGYTHSGTGTGATGYTTGTTDLPSDYTAEGTVVEDYPAGSEFLSGTQTGTGAGIHEPRVARGRHTGHGTGGGTY